MFAGRYFCLLSTQRSSFTRVLHPRRDRPGREKYPAYRRLFNLALTRPETVRLTGSLVDTVASQILHTSLSSQLFLLVFSGYLPVIMTRGLIPGRSDEGLVILNIRSDLAKTIT